MKKTVTAVCLALIVLTFVFMFVYCTFFPREELSDYVNLKEKPVFSLESLFSGEYFNGMSQYFTDTVHGRDRFIDYEARIRSLYGVTENETVHRVDGSAENPSSADASSSLPDRTESSRDLDISHNSHPGTYDSSEVSYDPGETSEDKQGAEISGSILIVGSRGMELFGGNDAQAVRFAQVISEFAESLDPSIKVYSMPVPKASAYYLALADTEKYNSYLTRNKDTMDLIRNNLSDRVTDINVYNILGVHSNEHIYFRTDHHWTALGAYYGAKVFCEQAGLGISDLSEYRKYVRENYIGTLYKFSGNNPVLLNNPEDLETYVPPVGYSIKYYSNKDFTGEFDHFDTSNGEQYTGLYWFYPDKYRSEWYSTFLHGDLNSVIIKSEACRNGRKLLLVKDSYGNALPQYLLEAYEEIYVVDGRTFTVPLRSIINDYGITDVLFAESLFSAVSKKIINQVKELCK